MHPDVPEVLALVYTGEKVRSTHDIIGSLDEIPKELRGLHPKNPVNIPPLAGVQLELPPTLRWNREEWGWSDNGGIGRAKQVDTLIASLSSAVKAWPL